MRKFARIEWLATLMSVMTSVAIAQSQTSGITYQGQLKLNDAPVDGAHDAEFRLFGTATGGAPIGSHLINGLMFENGLFTATLNDAGQFGSTAFNGQQRWLEIVVDGQVLSPRQALSTTPYAAFSLNTRGLNVASNGNVGIGAVSPQRMLHLAAANDAVMRLQSTGSSGRSYDMVSSGATGQLRIEENGNLRLLMAPGGFMNIGNGTPDRPLCIAGAGGSLDLMTFQSSSGGARWFFSLNNGGLNFGEAVAGNPTRMFFEPGGMVGIGTTNPTAALDVVGTVKATTIEAGDTVRTRILHITGGSDIAEPYDVNADDAIRQSPAQFAVEPGMVVSIDPSRVGELRIASKAYDSTVAGIVSGANGVNVGLTLTQEGSVADGKHPIAMTGRVWCLVDADGNGAIQPGDLLTTSSTPGHAMKATDREQMNGAVIGKAMSSLDSGKGLVLVLVNLQ